MRGDFITKTSSKITTKTITKTTNMKKYQELAQWLISEVIPTNADLLFRFSFRYGEMVIKVGFYNCRSNRDENIYFKQLGHLSETEGIKSEILDAIHYLRKSIDE